MEDTNQNPEAPQEESIFSDVEVDTSAYEKHIRNARIVLFVIAGLQIIPIFLFDEMDELAYRISVGVQIFFVLAFAGMAFWSKYHPFAALVTALSFYSLILMADVIFDPTSLVKGIIIKIIVIVLLIRGISNAREARDMKRTFDRK